MGRVRWRLYYHVIWTTKGRAPWIDKQHKPRLLGAMRAKCIEMGGSVREIGAVVDHVHVCCEMPPAVAVSKMVWAMKGASSHMANHELGLDYHFAWQEGYGVLSLGAGDLPRVCRYIRDQERHHSNGSLVASLEAFEAD
ncbi:MAG TPA: IS200/IS605 family transposase [Armatimonadota bacterium]|nr:IS200/IS605 family transposase [Armatimonadota bacterium]HPT99283.1 IS200/IS605 family transposase [Armatimonadota bacterium]